MLSDQAVVITGGSRGIGAAIAIACAEAGAKVAVLGRSVDQLEAVAKKTGGTAVQCDVTSRENVEAALDASREALGGKITVLVNNAGIAAAAKIVKTTDELWHNIIATNLHGTFYATRYVLPEMLERENGRIINIASIAGKVGQRYTGAYCASKHAVIGLTRALAIEVATKGITVNAVCPGWVDTEMAGTAIAGIAANTKLNEEQARRALESDSPQNRLMTSEEVASLVVYLASSAATAINGQAINVDGGGVTS